ncbi:mucin-2-like isoform X2 [Dermacentor albipictus]|uniref:mucin-2-like isoform X2 n=1 Tax=Dermacentor albipictus TaxID=60249 RepID=UPI0038FD28C3
MHSRDVVFVFYIISGILENTTNAQEVEPAPNNTALEEKTETQSETTSTASDRASKNETTSTASDRGSKNDETEQTQEAKDDTTAKTSPKPTSTQGTPPAPVTMPDDTTAKTSAKPTSTQGTPPAPVTMPVPISLPTILNTRGGGPFGPAIRNPYLVRHACKFFGNSCLPTKSCKKNWRLPLLGCRKNEVCCNSRKTRNCSKLGGKCRNGCRNYGVPYPVATCKIRWEKCCIRVQ